MSGVGRPTTRRIRALLLLYAQLWICAHLALFAILGIPMLVAPKGRHFGISSFEDVGCYAGIALLPLLGAMSLIWILFSRMQGKPHLLRYAAVASSLYAVMVTPGLAWSVEPLRFIADVEPFGTFGVAATLLDVLLYGFLGPAAPLLVFGLPVAILVAARLPSGERDAGVPVHQVGQRRPADAEYLRDTG